MSDSTPDHRVIVSTVALGGWYPRGAARMIEQFHRVSPGFELQAWCNIMPPGAQRMIEGGYNYTGYAAKPWALKAALDSGADVALLLDAAFYPIRQIHPLIDHIAQHGYYLCRNGYKAGEWTSDRCLKDLMCGREEAMETDDVSSYCVGISRWHPAAITLAERWAALSTPKAICGPHTAPHEAGRNKGFVSLDHRVRGHRHDQSVLSILAHRLGMDKLSARPLYTAYRGYEDETTVLIDAGPDEAGELTV